MRLLSVFFFILASFAHSYTLEDALRDALLHNDTAISLSKQIKLASLKKDMAPSKLLPTALLGLSYDFNKDPWTSEPPNPRIGITISQSISSPISPVSTLLLAKHEYLTTKFSYTGTLNDVILQIIHAYLEVIASKEILLLNKETVRALEMNLDAVQKSLKVGESTKGELAYTKAKFLAARSQLLESKSDYENKRSSFLYLVGKENAQIELKDPILHSEYLPKTLEESITLAVASSPHLKAAKNAQKLANLRVVESVERWLPSVKFETTLQYIPFGKKMSDGVRKIGTQTMVNVGLPLFTGGRNTLATSIAYVDKSLKEHEYHAKSKLLKQEVQKSWNRYHNALLFVAASKELIKAAEISVESIKHEAQLDLKSNLNVVDAEIELLKAKAQLRQAKNARIGAFYKLFFMTHGGEALNILLGKESATHTS